MPQNILGLIQSGEGNYNSANYKTQPFDLSQYTVAGVRSAFPTGAVGAYQVMPYTWAAATRGIDPNSQFTPAVQDQMAINLANIRGLQDYNNGTLRIEVRGFNQDQQLQYNFSKEWAAIPAPAGARIQDGRISDGTLSYYDGVGTNKANPALGGENFKQAIANSKDLKAGDGIGQQKGGIATGSLPAAPADLSKNIYFIDANFHTTT
jgi:hypothetical protein